MEIEIGGVKLPAKNVTIMPEAENTDVHIVRSLELQCKNYIVRFSLDDTFFHIEHEELPTKQNMTDEEDEDRFTHVVLYPSEAKALLDFLLREFRSPSSR